MTVTPPDSPSEDTTSGMQASDHTTMVDVVSTFEAEGYTGQMAAREGGLVMCYTCRQESPAQDAVLHALRRTEGASDPADMAAVAALDCPNCGAHGTVVLKYGPEASPEENEVLALLDDQRSASAGGVVPSGDTQTVE